MTRRLFFIIAAVSVIPLPVSAALEYARPRFAFVFVLILALGAIASVAIAAAQWRRIPQDQATGELATPPSRRGVLIAIAVAVVCSVLAVIAFQWRVLRETAIPFTPDVSLRRLEVASSTILNRHYPSNGSVGVPRNSSIFLWFDEPIDRSSIIADHSTSSLADDEPNPAVVRIWADGDPSAPRTLVRARARSNSSATIVAVDPLELLGSSSRSTLVTVELEGIKTIRGRNALGSSNAYRWSFTVAKTQDRIAPRIVNAFPLQGASQVPANAGIQLTWGDPLDPLSFESSLEVLAAGQALDGSWFLAAGERIAEFFPSNPCGFNQCRRQRGCWPFSTIIQARSAAVDTGIYPLRGIRDVHGNLLAPPAQTLVSFRSGNTLHGDALTVARVNPPTDSSGVRSHEEVSAEFSSILKASSLAKDAVRLEGDGEIQVELQSDYGKGNSRVIIRHEPFLPHRALNAILSSDIEDMYQNCFASCIGP